MCLLSTTFIVPNPALAEYEKNYIGEMQTYTAVYEDTLVHLARTYNMGFVEVRAANPELDPWIPGAGAEVIIPSRHLLPDAPHKGIVINLPEMRIYAYLNGDDAPSTFPIGVGREGLGTPMGDTEVIRKTVGPTWTPTQRMRDEKPELPLSVPPGPENPLGTHALYLGWPTYAIHGTNKPYGIGRRVSSGCIRMYPEGIVEFFDLVPVGTKVKVVNQPIKVTWIGNELYLEAHPDLDQALAMEESGEVAQQKLSEDDMKHIIQVAGKYEEYLNWPRIRTTLRERRGYPVKIAQHDISAEKDGLSQNNTQGAGSSLPDTADKEIVALEEETDSAPKSGMPVVIPERKPESAEAETGKEALEKVYMSDKVKDAALIGKPKSKLRQTEH